MSSLTDFLDVGSLKWIARSKLCHDNYLKDGRAGFKECPFCYGEIDQKVRYQDKEPSVFAENPHCLDCKRSYVSKNKFFFFRGFSVIEEKDKKN